MFSILCNRLIINNCNRATRSTLTQGFDFLHNSQYVLLSRFNFISTDVEPDSFAVSYLMNTLGISHKTALASSKYLNLKSSENPDSVLALLEKHGITKPQVKLFVERFPKVLLYDPVKTLLPKIHFFESKGISGVDLGTVVTAYHTPFRCNLEKHIIPCFNFISNLLDSHEEAVATIKRHPMILSPKLETQVRPYVNMLRENGVSLSNIVLFLRYLPAFKSTKWDKFEEDLQMVKEMGISPFKSQFIVALIGIRPMDKTKWQEKVDVYKKWGFSEEQVVASFVKLPWFMVASEDKINAAMDFFVNEMGWGTSVIVKRPGLISLSLKKRLIPRAAVFKYLTSNGLLKTKGPNFTKYMELTEKEFLERYVSSYDEAPALMKLYKEKLDSL